MFVRLFVLHLLSFLLIQVKQTNKQNQDGTTTTTTTIVLMVQHNTQLVTSMLVDANSHAWIYYC